MRYPPGRCYGGGTDVPLADGWDRLLPDWLDTLRPLGVATVWSSPLGRCRLPAERLGAALGVPVRLDPRLREIDFGDWEGRDWNDVPRDLLDVWGSDPIGFSAPGGEGGGSLIRRIRSVLHDLSAAAVNCLVVSHGGPLRLLGPMLQGAPPDLLAAAPPMGTIQVVCAALPSHALPPGSDGDDEGAMT
ncbi:histidine phosphatase family protein [Lichenicola sp.]|uniref:histidine phosphatase family protein n=1 Tax=Lichenicola sp. TaxID=2804529 RepID=UPI003AFF80CF